MPEVALLMSKKSTRGPIEDTSLLPFHIRAHTMYFTYKSKHIAIQHEETEQQAWKKQIWNGFLSLSSFSLQSLLL